MFTNKYKPNFPYMTISDFETAVDVLNQCYVTKTPRPLSKPYFKPGACPYSTGDYGDNYWSLDYSLAVDGAKWLDDTVAYDFIENMYQIIEEDGRIRLYTADVFTSEHGVFTEKIGSIPKCLETCYDIAIATSRKDVQDMAFSIMTRNLNWWLKNRQDAETKLISAVFEETFVPNGKSGAYVYCPMDTNIEIYLGFRHASELAALLGKPKESQYLQERANEILNAVSTFLWDEEDGTYYPYILPLKKRYKIRVSSMFLGLYVGNAERNRTLIRILTDDREFNFNTYPLTTVSKLDPLFTTVNGDYTGNPCWLGSVWTLTNYAVIRALKDNGYADLAHELSQKTLAVFQGKYAEFVHPITGEKNGMQKYAWTASQCIRIYLEEICGYTKWTE